MCGITIYNGIPIRATHVWNNVLQLKDRGKEDGFGYIDITNNIVHKTTLSLDEINNSEISMARIGLKEKDKKNITLALNNLKLDMNKHTEFIAMHNRKASCGKVNTQNTHPFKISKDIFYMHNGTFDGYELIKNYAIIMEGAKFSSNTDSEFLAWLVESEIKKGIKLDKIFDKINAIFTSGFGVLVRIDKKNKQMIIFKDVDRTLYLYKSDDSNLLISEPINSLTIFNKCIRLDKGIIVIQDKEINHVLCVSKDITNKLRESFKLEARNYKCDNCKNENNTRNVGANKDYCLACITSDIDLKKKENETTFVTTSCSVSFTKDYSSYSMYR
jgi:glucosamine 6-phosphate synthetase-like amidotransferase/phosphosugar isomerase protein